MASYHKQNLHTTKKKISISYVIRDKEERYHRAGVNALQYDSQLDRLYSAGRDSIVRIWGFADRPNKHNETAGSRNTVASTKQSNQDHFIQSMEHHTDWVNDITLCCDGRNLISVSNDTTIKVWNAYQGFCLSTLRSHKDYAKCLAYARSKEIVATAGFDRMIYLWDIQALTMLTANKNTVTTKPLEGSKSSTYSLAINHTGTLVASGSTEKVIRLWDPRSRQKVSKLRGHTDNVRSLLFSKDGSLLLSASSDSTIRLWSVPQQRCISIIRVHDEGVWTLQADESFSVVYSGGKDRKIHMTDLKNTSNTSMICEETAPILRLLLVDRSFGGSSRDRSQTSLWVSTTDSAIKNWPIKSDGLVHFDDPGLSDKEEYETLSKLKPDVRIQGKPAVINYNILNDKRHILTLESDNSVVLYDVLNAQKVETIQPKSKDLDPRKLYEEELKKRQKMVYVPNWFTVDLKIGLLCIHLEESECLSAWASARDYGFLPHIEGQDPKINLGCLMLQALLEYWPPTFVDQEAQDVRSYQIDSTPDTNIDERHILRNSTRTNQLGIRQRSSANEGVHPIGLGQKVANQYFSIASHTPVIISEEGQTILRFLAYEASNENEDLLIQEILPPWITDIVINKCQPKFTKIPFFLLPHANSGIKSLRKERLSASDMLQMRKIIEHVREKMIVNVSEEGGSYSTMVNQEAGSNAKAANSSSSNENHLSAHIEKVELYCNDQKLDENLDLRTVKHFIWKTGSDLILHYMPIN